MRITRRRFLVLSGTGAAGAALGGYLASSSPPDTWAFRSRPDLRPPLIQVRTTGTPLGSGSTFVTPAGPMIVDDAGSPIWCRPVSLATTNLRVQQYRGAPVLTWWQGRITSYGTGEGEGVVLDSSYRELARVRGADGLSADLHELVLTSRGTAYLTAYGLVEADLRPVGGPRRGQMVESAVQEVDLATGALLFSWRASEHLGLGESEMGYSASQPFDPVHLNSIEELPDGSLLVSARNTWALYRVSCRTGQILWRLGGRRSDFRVGPGAGFAWQHDARAHPGGSISLFDDEASPAESSQSRGLVLAVDEAARRVALTRSYLHQPDPLLAGSQGSVQELANGQVLVGWGSQPYYSQFRGDGTLVADAHILKGISYRAYRGEWSGTPTGPPAVAVEGRPGGPGKVFVSWNGSTETVAWHVLDESGPAGPERLARVPRSGFETAIPLDRLPGRLAVQALSAAGAVLAVARAAVPG